MRIYVVRHGETDLNLGKKMQGCRTDAPLNETGKGQAAEARRKLLYGEGGKVQFDAVFASPLIRAVETAEIIGDAPENEIIKDERLREADFGKYEKKPYAAVGIPMSLYWVFPEIFPAPDTVETVAEMKERSVSFLQELEKKSYKSVLISCHGGIMRVLSGYLADRKNGLMWRPKPKNCEIRVFESEGGRHTYLRSIL